MNESVTILALWIGVAYANVEFKIKNFHAGPIWIGTQGGNNLPPLESGGFLLDQGAEKSVSAPDNWEGRFWARTWCDPGSNHCQTGDCGNKIACNGAGGVPPATLVEIKIKGHGGEDFYDLSLVDGYNSMALIRPVGGRGRCPTLQCKKDLNADCPADLKVIHNGITVACNSACNKYNDAEYCCSGNFNNPNVCNPNNWPASRNSAKYFKDNCPDAYSYAYDDKSSLQTCTSNTYEIEFG